MPQQCEACTRPKMRSLPRWRRSCSEKSGLSGDCSVVISPDRAANEFNDPGALKFDLVVRIQRGLRNGSVWESNPLTAFFKPPAGFEDQGPHQRCKHSPGAALRIESNLGFAPHAVKQPAASRAETRSFHSPFHFIADN